MLHVDCDEPASGPGKDLQESVLMTLSTQLAVAKPSSFLLVDLIPAVLTKPLDCLCRVLISMLSFSGLLPVSKGYSVPACMQSPSSHLERSSLPVSPDISFNPILTTGSECRMYACTVSLIKFFLHLLPFWMHHKMEIFSLYLLLLHYDEKTTGTDLQRLL